LHGEWSWVRTQVIRAIASCEAFVSTLQEASIDGSKLLTLISTLDFQYSTYFIMINIAFHKSFLKWNNARVPAERTEHSTSDRPERFRDITLRYWARERRRVLKKTSAAIKAMKRALKQTLMRHRAVIRTDDFVDISVHLKAVECKRIEGSTDTVRNKVKIASEA